MSDSDAELQRLAPDEAILDASVPPLPLEQIVRTPGPATATGPALGERAYDLRLDPASGRRYREFSGPKISRSPRPAAGP